MNAFGMKRNKRDKGIKEKAKLHKSKRNNSIKSNSN